MATVEEMRARREAILRERVALGEEDSRLVLAIEEAEGRPDSHEARFARAHLAHDSAAMSRCCAEDVAERYRETGRWSTYQDEARKILDGEAQR